MLVGTALVLTGDTPALDASLQSRVQTRVTKFNAEVRYSRPIGFYTWTSALAHIFTRDRFLQNNDDSEPFGAFAALHHINLEVPEGELVALLEIERLHHPVGDP